MVKIKTIIKKKVNKTICVHKTELTACSMAVACLHKKTNTNFGDNVNKVNKQKVSLEFHAYIVQHCTFVKFIYSEKATNFCEISTVDLSYVVTVKSYSGDFTKFCGLLKGQLISKCLFWYLQFSQKSNENF